MNQNTLYYGDNLDILREYIQSESIDLIYLDPPFNSKRNYNILFKDESGVDSEAQTTAFDDTWHWNNVTEATYNEIATQVIASNEVATMIIALRGLLHNSQMMAYLVMMTARLIELHRVLKPTGSLYLHCDPTASHYLKVVLDTIFGPENFQNEIVWRRTGSHNKIRRYAPIHDIILFFSKTDNYTWNYPKRPYMKGHIEANFIKDAKGYRTNYYGNVLTGSGVRGGESGKPWHGFNPTAKGRHWAIPGALLEDMEEDLSHLSQHQKLDRLLELGHIKIIEGQAWPMYERYLKPGDGQPIYDILAYQPYTEGTVFGTDLGIDADVRWLPPKDQERLGYPTQKPIALLERIIQASSKPGDVVLDPFCGCGTTIAAAQKLDRKWMGIDVTYLSISLQKYRLKDAFKIEPVKDYHVVGEPVDLHSAKQLAQDNRYDFQWWALSLIQARALGGDSSSKKGKKGADKGIDGVIIFMDGAKNEARRIIVQVKSGNVKVSDIRDLVGTVEREKAAIGVFITLDNPSKVMVTEAVTAGYYHSPIMNRDYPKIQILSIQDLLHHKVRVEMPASSATFKQAQKIKPDAGSQAALFDDI